MNSITHSVAPDQIMALLDGELTAAEANAINAHLAECGDCAVLRDQLRGTSQTLRQWTVPAFPTETARAVQERIDRTPVNSVDARPQGYTRLSFRNWRLWAIGAGGAAATALACVILVGFLVTHEDRRAFMMMAPNEDKANANPGNAVSTYAYSGQQSGVAGMENLPISGRSLNQLAKLQPGIVGGSVPAPAGTQPMIARSATMTVLVKNFEAARRDLESIMARHHAYAADLTILDETPPPGLQGSLRVPVSELPAFLSELRSLGHVEKESQSGEEVTQQHTDLVARLTNARETEARLRDILAHRTGKMEEVLDVEEKISETRGGIEQMEAEQNALEHRVEFASIDLKVVEEYKATLGDGADRSVGTEMHNALVAGLRNAGGSLLALVLFFEEYGPALLLWAVILGGPVWLVWRIRRRTSGGL